MWSPDGNLDDLISHFPLELASVEPMSVFPALYSLTSELASAVPVNVGVVNEVMFQSLIHQDHLMHSYQEIRAL